jgi:hypothetical protein
MRILFDHGTPAPLTRIPNRPQCHEGEEAGWDKLVNSKVLDAAESSGFEVLVTTDKNIVDQLNLKRRAIAIVVLGNSQWRIVQRYVRRIAAVIKCG